MNPPTDPRARELLGLMGKLPDLDRSISCRKIGEEEREEYVLEWLVLDLNGIEDVPAFFTRPRKTDGPMPAILFNHSHGGNFRIGQARAGGGQYLPPEAALCGGAGGARRLRVVPRRMGLR